MRSCCTAVNGSAANKWEQSQQVSQSMYVISPAHFANMHALVLDIFIICRKMPCLKDDANSFVDNSLMSSCSLFYCQNVFVQGQPVVVHAQQRSFANMCEACNGVCSCSLFGDMHLFTSIRLLQKCLLAVQVCNTASRKASLARRTGQKAQLKDGHCKNACTTLFLHASVHSCRLYFIYGPVDTCGK